MYNLALLFRLQWNKLELVKKTYKHKPFLSKNSLHIHIFDKVFLFYCCQYNK